MPWKHEWVDPELAFTCHKFTKMKGAQYSQCTYIPVYRAYKDDNYNEPLSYWYTLHDGAPETDTNHASNHHGIFDFDIRDFPNYDETLSHQHIIQTAIDQELCTIEDVMIYIQPTNRGSDATQ
tara:strand:+ start:1102 stop:1470 length:369 start_codon:yes stop_codon:yes gene_type:complete